ncbi:hypothetical protein Glove_615g11 [Diversispora epigaea]|uniref:Kinase n=1 Tax=Diversispora epigaea TaxID=1348612 RepID=A0A397G7F6_9GLOM|nr:hypothetical protein Glove_615g11 [Diversispora epigaea]
MIRKAENTTSGSIGFKLTAFKVFKKSTESYINYSRDYCRKLTTDNIASSFSHFFEAEISVKLRQSIIECFIKDIESLIEVMKNEEMRLYGASLLFVYEGDPDILMDSINKEKQRNHNILLQKGEDIELDEDDEEDDDDDEEAEKDLKSYDLKVIDFAHSFFQENIGKDENTLFGLNNLLKILRTFVKI